MSVLFPSLLGIGLALVALPVLIHLINMLRHRRVKWAAMDFLLQSQKKYKKWIVFKQLLLLLMRMAAIAAVAYMIAQPIMKNEFGQLFGGANTHHIVLLDDSYSMSERWTDGSAFDRGKAVVNRLAAQAGAQGSAHSFSLLRFSGAANMASGGQLDVIQKTVDSEFELQLAEMLEQLKPSQTSATVSDALAAMETLPTKSDDENRIVYIVSDFRKKEWNEPTELRKTLLDLNGDNVTIRLVQCVDTTQPNLAITALAPREGIRAAGVPFDMEVAVTNYGVEDASGDGIARRVAIRLEENGHPRPGLEIKRIEPGETVVRRFRVQFGAAGSHTITASLPTDSVTTDNSRFAAIDLPDTTRCLVIDSGLKGRDAYMVSSVFEPGGKVQIGVAPQIEPPSFLRKRELLDQFHTIYLLNLDRLDAPEIAALEDFVQKGGGVAFFLGDRSTRQFFNEQLYREGEGLFPLPLALPTDLLVDRIEKSPDIEISEHPLFRQFLALRNNPLDDVLIQRYYAAERNWQPDPDSSVQVIAQLRNGAPLIVEQKFGDGRVLAILTKASPEKTDLGQWNNWARNPSFPITLFEMQGYLSAGKQQLKDRRVGQPLEMTLDPAEFKSKVVFSIPQGDDSSIQVIDADPKDESLHATLNTTGQSGLYEATLATVDDNETVRNFAYNVDPAEGDLAMLDSQQLAPRLTGLTYHFHRADDLAFDPADVAGFNLSEPILYGLIVLLILEQLMAYSTSYHPPRSQQEVAR